MNDPSAGSPTETVLRLLHPLEGPVCEFLHPNEQKNKWTLQLAHRTFRSVAATGGVYKGQGRNRHKLLTCAY